MTEQVIMAGFGGQGFLLIGKLYAAAAMHADREVTYFPSYGAEVRGGTAHCNVIVSDEPVHSPMVTMADTLLIMNQQSYDKFRPALRKNGLLVLNASLTAPDAALEAQSPARTLVLPATEMANELGNVRVANVIMLGAYAEARPVLDADLILAEIEKGMTGRKAHLLEINRQAFAKGRQVARDALTS